MGARHDRRALWIAALLLCLWCGNASAQQPDSIPRPDELGSASEDEVPVRILEPAEGAEIETPFTVSGTAPAGARLELWIGDTLERVFQADAKGRFTAPVSREVPHSSSIYVHQVGPRGKRVQSASVDVRWAGEKTATPTEKLVGKPPVDDSLVAEDPDPAPPATLTAPDDIPRTEDVDLETLDRAPVPPPVSEASGGLDPFAAADEAPVASSATSVQTTGRATTPIEPEWSRPARATLTSLAGLGGGVGLALGAGALFALIGVAAYPGSDAPLYFAIFGVAAGWVVGIPLGVMLAGRALDGNGKVWGAILGMLAGNLAAGVMSGAFAAAAPAIGAFAVFTFPAIGSAIGYELTSDPSRRAAEARQRGIGSLELVPFVAPTSDGGHTSGIGARFRF